MKSRRTMAIIIPMKNYAKWILFFAVVLSLALSASAKLYSYSDLHLKDFAEMSKMVQQKIDAALDLIQQNEDEELSVSEESARDAVADQKASEHLRDALQMILSRPDKDNLVEKLLPDVRRQLKNINSYDYTLESIAGEAIRGVKSETTQVKYRVTYLFLLENLMAELQPRVDDSPLAQRIFQKIRDAKIEIPKKVFHERRQRMYKQFSPSAVAEAVLKAHFKRRKSSEKKK